MAERNPYLILGVDFAASSDAARHAFAHAARRLRRDGGVWEIEDLNWALHEVEALEADPAELVSIYRVPANPSVFEPAGEGLFRPEPVALARRTPVRDEESLARVRRAALTEVDGALLQSLAVSVTTPPTPYEMEPEA